MSEVDARNSTTPLIERINALLPTVVHGQVINYLEFDLIANGIQYRKYMRSSRVGALGHVSEKFEYGTLEAERLFKVLCDTRDKAESVFPETMELNDKATATMSNVWNLAHGFIYDAKVYGTSGYPKGWALISTLYKEQMRHLAHDIWGSKISNDDATKENYLALKKQYGKFVAAVNSGLIASLI